MAIRRPQCRSTTTAAKQWKRYKLGNLILLQQVLQPWRHLRLETLLPSSQDSGDDHMSVATAIDIFVVISHRSFRYAQLKDESTANHYLCQQSCRYHLAYYN